MQSHNLVDNIPANWNTTLLRFLLKEKITDGPHETPEFVDEGYPFLSVDGIQNGELVFEGCRFISEEAHVEYSKKVKPIKGDLLMGKAASTGKIAQVKVDFEFSIWSPLAWIRPNKIISSDFLELVLKSDYCQAQIEMLCTHSTQNNISMQDIPRIRIHYPPRNVQNNISRYINEKISELNTVEEQLNLELNVLEEKRSTLITQAVTKGFDSNVSMKNSGIEWIGKIPEHWEIIPLKRDFEVQLGKMLQNEPKSDTDTHEYYLKSANIQWDGISLTPQVKMWLSESEKEKYLLKKGDLLVSEGGDVGRSCLYNDEYERCYIQNAINRVRPTGKVTTEYLYYFMKAMHHSGFVEIICNKSTIPHFTAEKVAEVRYTRPPISEISQIVESLNNACGQIAESITLIESTIIKLKEYRTALISAAATGKIDVREPL